MRKFQRATMIASLGSCLALFTIVCLTLISSTVLTSNINEKSAIPSGAKSDFSKLPLADATIKLEPDGDQKAEFSTSAGNSESQSYYESTKENQDTMSGRRRSGRLYSASSPAVANTQSQPVDSYAAAYAAVQSAEQVASHQQQQQQAMPDPSAYASFGETQQSSPPSTSQSLGPSSPASVARQLSGLSSGSAHGEYSAAPSASSYYANMMSPGSSGETSAHGSPMTSNYQTTNYLHERYAPQQPPPTNYQAHHNYYKSNSGLPSGYPTNTFSITPSSSYYDRMSHATAQHPSFWPISSFSTSSSSFPPTTSLMSSASHALSHWTNGITIGEIICGFIAVSIGAIILGAPFFLIYLALMGNFSGSGTLSLTNPTAAGGAMAAGGTGGATNGRRKRLAIFESGLSMDDHELARKHLNFVNFADSVVGELSPFVDLQQVSNTFKQLVRSIEKHSNMKKASSKSANRSKKFKEHDN